MKEPINQGYYVVTEAENRVLRHELATLQDSYDEMRTELLAVCLFSFMELVGILYLIFVEGSK